MGLAATDPKKKARASSSSINHERHASSPYGMRCLVLSHHCRHIHATLLHTHATQTKRTRAASSPLPRLPLQRHPSTASHDEMRRPPRYHRDRLRLLLACCCTLFTQTHACLQVAPTLGSHMVLQQAPRQAVIYGEASPGDAIKMTLSLTLPPSSGENVTTATTTTDFYGHWSVQLPPVPGGETSFVVLVVNERTEERVEMEDVLFGEVW